MININNFAENLRIYANEFKCLPNHLKDQNVQNMLLVAAEMIEELSAKLLRQDMDQSSKHYNGGWIPVDEKLPEIKPNENNSESVLVVLRWFNGDIQYSMAQYNKEYG